MKFDGRIERDRVPADGLTSGGIQDLPIELLITVISLASEVEPDNLTRAQWLSTVCSRWRAVVEENPEIWSQITGSDAPEIVKKAIDKSKDMSLDIDYHTKAHRDTHNPEDFLKTLFHHIHRWRRASIVLRTCNPDLLHGLTIGTAPRLESFTLSFGLYQGRPLTLFAGLSSPCLREFNVHRVLLLWDREQFSNLQKLEIVGYQRWSALSLQRVLSILRTMPRLEEFVYRGELGQVSEEENGAMSRRLIVLPVMKSLQLRTFGSSGALDILTCIRAPECRDVSVASTLGDLGEPGRLAQIYEAIVQFLLHMRAMTNQGECVQIKVDPMDVSLSISTIEFELSHLTEVIQVANGWFRISLTNPWTSTSASKTPNSPRKSYIS